MLVITRMVGESVRIDENVYLTVAAVHSCGRVRLAFDAPRSVPIVRTEIMHDRPEPHDLRVALIEDDGDFARVMRRALENAGVRDMEVFPSCRLARTAFAAFRTGEVQPPDVIFLDYRLPDGPGTDLLAELKGDTSGLATIPVVVFSNHAEERVVEACLGGGASAFLEKADSFADIQASVRRVIGLWSDPKMVRRPPTAADPNRVG